MTMTYLLKFQAPLCLLTQTERQAWSSIVWLWQFCPTVLRFLGNMWFLWRDNCQKALMKLTLALFILWRINRSQNCWAGDTRTPGCTLQMWQKKKKKTVNKPSVIGVLRSCTERTNCWEYLRHKSQEKLWGIFIKDLKSQSDTRTWQCVTLCDWIVKIAWKHQGERWYEEELSWVIPDVNYSSVWMMLWQRRQAHLDL